MNDEFDPFQRSADVMDNKRRWSDEFGKRLEKLRDDCNKGADPSQIQRAETLLTEARAHDSRVEIARACLEHAYVLLALERSDKAIPYAQEARRVLLDGRQPALDAFASHAEREWYLMAARIESWALVALQKWREVLELCIPVIDDIEMQRMHVNSPYAQGSFLGENAELYEMCAEAARELGELDRLLATTDLLKAHTTITGRTAAADSAEVIELTRCCRAEDAALAAADPDVSSTDELRERRRRLYDARAISLATARAAVSWRAPSPTVAAVQAALGADEVLLSWFWIGRTVLIAQLFARDRAEALPIRLGAKGRTLLDAYLKLVKALSGRGPGNREIDTKKFDSRCYRLINDKLERVLLGLAEHLLPLPVQNFLVGCKRLTVSAHRELHLVPFQALPWKGGWLIEAMAVRYLPNVTSFLLPWRGLREGPVLAVGVKNFDDRNLDPLEHAKDEAVNIARVYGTLGVSLVDDPTVARLLDEPLGHYRCLHFATHGSSVLEVNLLNDPLACGIWLKDGLLDARTIESLDLHAEVVVLATCYSGQRAIDGRGMTSLPGDDLFGLQGALFNAGVNTVLGALWPVSDKYAPQILADFHTCYAAGAVPDFALREALLRYLDLPFRLLLCAPFFLSMFGSDE